MAELMRKLNKILGIKSKMLIVFHPQMDGQTERVNQELEQYLRMFTDHRQEQWSDWLETAEFIYNNKMYSSTKMLSCWIAFLDNLSDIYHKSIL